jgi:hypothetical protein
MAAWWRPPHEASLKSGPLAQEADQACSGPAGLGTLSVTAFDFDDQLLLGFKHVRSDVVEIEVPKILQCCFKQHIVTSLDPKPTGITLGVLQHNVSQAESLLRRSWNPFLVCCGSDRSLDGKPLVERDATLTVIANRTRRCSGRRSRRCSRRPR